MQAKRSERQTKQGMTPRPLVGDLGALRMSDNLAYFLGLWVAEGSFDASPGGSRITITCGDPSVGQFLQSGDLLGLKFKQSSGRTDQWRISQRELVDLMEYLDMPLVKAPQKWVPQWVMNGKRSWAQHFIAGLWDGDGYCLSNGKVRIGFNSASQRLVRDLQLLMSNMGVVGGLSQVITEPTERVAVRSLQHRYTIQGANVGLFRDSIPLRIERKQAALDAMPVPSWSRRDGVPGQGELLRQVRNGCRRCDRGGTKLTPRHYFSAAIDHGCDVSYRGLEMFVEEHRGQTSASEACLTLEKNLSDGYYWDTIAELEDSSALTYDFTIPETHSFWSNGFVSHNTPKAFNLLHTLYMHGQDKRMKEWASWQFPTITSPFIPESEIEQARRDLDKKSFEQEFMASFVSMSGRVYYPFTRAKHVGHYPFNPNLPIWVGQDFNIDPMASVIMQPQKNGELWVVDEMILPASSTADVATGLEQRYWRHMHQVVIYPDATGGSRQHARGESDLDIFREHGFSTILHRPRNPPVADRVNAVCRMLQNARGDVRLKIDQSCQGVIRSLDQTIYKENSRDVNKQMGVEHAADALGYPIEFEFPLRRFGSLGISI
jgi:hypothetical protein